MHFPNSIFFREEVKSEKKYIYIMRVLLLFSCLVFYFILFLDLLAKVSDISILNWVYNTLHNQSTTIKGFNLYSYGPRL